MDRFERIIFLQGEAAEAALDVLDTEGRDAALRYLLEWHYPGEHETAAEPAAGLSDTVYRKNNYIMSYSTALGYIGLEYDLKGA